MGKLDEDLKELMKKQKRAMTTNGPHPHHPVIESQIGQLTQGTQNSQG